MAALGNFYLDAATLELATAVYTDSALTTKAADQWYKEGYVTREQSGGVLLAKEDCALCPEDCESGVGDTIGANAYYADVRLPVGTGAVVVTVTPTVSLIGVIMRIGLGNYVNGGSSANFGWLQGCLDRPTFIGDIAGDCGIGGVTHAPITEFSMQNGVWTPTGLLLSVDAWTCQVVGTVGATGAVKFVVPKLLQQEETLRVEFYGVCGGTAGTFSVECPVLLTPINAKLSSEIDFPTACATAYDGQMFNVPVTGTAGVPALYDIIYADFGGSTKWADIYGAGFVHYEIGGVSKWVEIDANSVVINLANC